MDIGEANAGAVCDCHSVSLDLGVGASLNLMLLPGWFLSHHGLTPQATCLAWLFLPANTQAQVREGTYLWRRGVIFAFLV